MLRAQAEKSCAQLIEKRESRSVWQSVSSEVKRNPRLLRPAPGRASVVCVFTCAFAHPFLHSFPPHPGPCGPKQHSPDSPRVSTLAGSMHLPVEVLLELQAGIGRVPLEGERDRDRLAGRRHIILRSRGSNTE